MGQNMFCEIQMYCSEHLAYSENTVHSTIIGIPAKDKYKME